MNEPNQHREVIKEKYQFAPRKEGLMVTNTTYSIRIVQAREHAKLSQRGLVSKVSELQGEFNLYDGKRGLSRTTVYRLENGGKECDKFTILIALVCGVNPVWLVDGSGEMLLPPFNNLVDSWTAQQPPPSADDDDDTRTVPLIRQEFLLDYLQSGGLILQDWVEEWVGPIAHLPEEQSAFAMQMNRNRLEPEFSKGYIIILIKFDDGENNVKNNRLDFHPVADGNAFRMLVKPDGKWILKPLNPHPHEQDSLPLRDGDKVINNDFNMLSGDLEGEGLPEESDPPISAARKISFTRKDEDSETKRRKIEYGIRVTQARRHAKFTQKELAGEVTELQREFNIKFRGDGFSQSSVHRLERGDEEHNRFTTLLALVCGVNPVWLAEGRGEMLLHPSQRVFRSSSAGDSSPSVEVDQERTVPLIRKEYLQEYLNSPEPVQEEWVEQWLQPLMPLPEGVPSFAMRVQGEGMAFEFIEGDVVIFIKHEGVIDELQNKFVLCCHAGQGFYFRKLTKNGGGWVLRPENPSYQDRKYQKDFDVIFLAKYKYKEYL